MRTPPYLRLVARPRRIPAIDDLRASWEGARTPSGHVPQEVPGPDRSIAFLAFVAHELRSPLAPIRTAAALITAGRPEDLARAQRVIERQVDHLARMVDDLLDLARSRTGKLTLSKGPLEMRDVLEQAVLACMPTLSRRGQYLEATGLGIGCPLHADATRLVQIVTNLLDNASKFSADDTTVTLALRRLEHSVELAVMDQGIGMDAATLANVFDPFAQALHSTGFGKSGLGIGLAIVRQLVEAHGGRVRAESAGIGCGSRFVVTLPLTSCPQES